MSRSCRWSGPLAALVLALIARASAADLIVNGSFESGPEVPNPPGWSVKIPAGSTALTGWEILPGDIEYVMFLWENASDERSVGLNGTMPGGIAQTIATTPGGVYEVAFSMSGDAATVPYIKTMRVESAGQFHDFDFDVQHTWPWGMGWVRDSMSFTATGTTTRIAFSSLMPDSTGPALDSLSVVQTADPPPPPPPLEAFELAVAPNPARQSASVNVTIPQASHVRVAVLDLAGREVVRLADGAMSSGQKPLTWDGSVSGGRARPGVYFIRLTAPGTEIVRRFAFAP